MGRPTALATAMLFAGAWAQDVTSTRVSVPDTIPTRVGATTISAPASSGGRAWFLRGRDADGNVITSTTTATATGVTSASLTVGAAPFVPLEGATTVLIGTVGFGSTNILPDPRTFFVGGGVPAAGASINVATFNPDTAAWTPSLATAGVAPSARTGVAAAFVPRCDVSSPANPIPCIVVFGGQDSTGLRNDVWVLWHTRPTPTWQLVVPHATTGLAPGQPTARSGAAAATSSDGTTVYLYGGVTGSGPTSDVFAIAPAGFPDPRLEEMTNVARNFVSVRNSTTALQWTDGRGPIAAVDGDLAANHASNGQRCTHSNSGETQPWWGVVLNGTQNIAAIRIVPRSDGSSDRMRSYRMWMSTTDSGSGVWPATAPPYTRPEDELTQTLPNIIGAPTTIVLTTPRPTRFFWFGLRAIGAEVFLTLCEVELYVRRPWVMRQLSGVSNVAVSKRSAQSSSRGAGGFAGNANDGMIGQNNFNFQPLTCTHTATVPNGQMVWWQVDLGEVYDLRTVRIFPRQDCCTAARLNDINVYAGLASRTFTSSTLCYSGVLRTPAGAIIADAVNPAVPAFADIACPVKARFVTIMRPNNYATTNGDNNQILSLCEVQTFAETLPGLPTPRRDFSFVTFRGHLVVYGGSDARGFRQPDIRFFDLDARKWLPGFTPLGSPLSARGLAGLGLLGPRALVIHGGSTAGDASAEAAVLTFPACPALESFVLGVSTMVCNAANTMCTYTCFSGFRDVNGGSPVVCKEDGTVTGSLPPCIQLPAPLPPTGVALAWNNISNVATVTWAVPRDSDLGYYGTVVSNLGALQATRVIARPLEHLETFSNGNFEVPLAWRRYQVDPTRNTGFVSFDGGQLTLTAAPQTEYWGPLGDNNTFCGLPPAPLTPPGSCTTMSLTAQRTALIMVRDWPTLVNPALEWAMETEIRTVGQSDGSTFALGLMDTGLAQSAVITQDAQFTWGIRYTDAGGYVLQLECLNNRHRRQIIVPPGATSAYLRIERITDPAKERDWGNSPIGLFRFFYKFTAGARWIRLYDTNTWREMSGIWFNTTSRTVHGPGGRPQNFKPFFLAKATQASDLSRATAIFSYLKITQGIVIPSPGATRILPHPVPGAAWVHNRTTVPGLTPGAAYQILVQWRTTAGWGSTNVPLLYTVPLPTTAMGTGMVQWGTREVGFNRPAWISTTFNAALVFAAQGNDGNWGMPQFHTACSTNGEWWGIDLGVDYAAVRHVTLRNRCEANNIVAFRFRHFAVYIGQDSRGPRTTNAMVDQSNWDNYTIPDDARAAARSDGIPNVPVRTFAHGFYNATTGRAEPRIWTPTIWTEDEFYCRFQIPTVGYGRYLYLANGIGVSDGCLHIPEIQVWVPNLCPTRATPPNAQVDTTGGRGCDFNNNRFGRVCRQTCAAPFVMVSGVSEVTCNGEGWIGGPATPVVCDRTCPALDSIANTEVMLHTIIDEDFVDMTAGEISRLASLDPVQSPFARTWAYTGTSLEAMGRLGIEMSSTAVFTIEKIRTQPASVPFVYTATFTTTDKAGLVFRVADDMNYYMAYVDPVTDKHGIDVVLGGVYFSIGTVHIPISEDNAVTLSVSVRDNFMNMSVNGKVVLEVADGSIAEGWPGLFAQSTASFTAVRYVRETSDCSGTTVGETCTIRCQAGLITQGSVVRTCLATAQWSGAATVCTLNPPTFPRATITVRENSARGALVGNPLSAVSSSPDFPVAYTVVNTYNGVSGMLLTPDLFSVDFCSGQVKVRRNGFLDFETLNAYFLELRAYIAGFPDAFTDANMTVQVLDVDEAPVVNRTIIAVREQTARSAVVGRVQVIDPENHPVSYALSVDNSAGRFAVHPVTGFITLEAAPGNRSGFPSMSTGDDAPINFESFRPMDLVVTVRQTGGMGTATMPGDPTFTATGTVTITLTDENDPPYVYRDQVLVVLENNFRANFVVGTINSIDEDTNAAATMWQQVSPALCGVSGAAQWPNTRVPGSTAATLTLGTDNLFDVNAANGQVTIARVPSQAYRTVVGNDDLWPTFLRDNRVVRAEYTLCINVSDAMGATVSPVRLVVEADPIGTPTISTWGPNNWGTAGGTAVIFTGTNFWPGAPAGGAPPIRAWFTNGIEFFNATSCAVRSDTEFACTVPTGWGTGLEWSFILNNRRILLPSPIIMSYGGPTVNSVSGHSNMNTTGQTVRMTGQFLGPIPDRRVAVTYGPTGTEFNCPVSRTQGTVSEVICQSSEEGFGSNMVFRLAVGGQLATGGTAINTLWSYAAPVITSVVAGGAGYTLDRLDPLGGQQIIVNGRHFGGLTVPFAVTFGDTAGTLYDMPCIKQDSASAHFRLVCTTPRGMGTNHPMAVTVGSRTTAPFFALGAGRGIGYMSPVILSITGPGWRNADTVGSQAIVITGRHFGPATVRARGSQTDINVVNSVTYGMTGETGRYTAVACSVTTVGNPGIITCLSAPGIGRGFRLALIVGGQAANHTNDLFPDLAQVATQGGSYAPPTIIAFSGPGSAEAETVGGQSVVITGRNFGPADAYTASMTQVLYGTVFATPIRDVTETRVAIANVSYAAASCVVSVAHTELTCATAEGAGDDLTWDVIVAGQKSATPTTAYARPVVEAILLANPTGGTISEADVDGGSIAILNGNYFGPTAYRSTGRPLIQKITFGSVGTEYVIPPSAWLAVTHTQISVVLPPGMGSNLIFRVEVGDQVSTSPAGAVFAYAAPQIVLLDPGVVSTYSDPRQPTLLTLVVRNLPLRDSQARFTVALGTGNGNPRLLTPAVPVGAQAIAQASNRQGPLAGTVNITVLMPTHGGGRDVGVELRLSRSTSTAVVSVSPVSLLQYYDPLISDVVVTRAIWLSGNESNPSPDAIPCPFTSGVWSCTDPSIYRIEVQGRDFTTTNSGWADGISRSLDLLVLTDPILGDVYSDRVLFPFSWTHTSIVFYTRLSVGTLRILINSTAFDGSPRGQTLIQPYRDMSPQVLGVTGPTNNVPTTGGSNDDPLVLTVEAISGATNVEVTVGSFTAVLLQPSGPGAYTPIPNIGTWLAAPNNPQNNANVWTLYVRLPPGQGRDLPILVTKTSSSGRQGSNTGWRVSYAPPVLTRVQTVIRRGDPSAELTIDFFTSITVPTDGSAVVRLYGTNLGVAPDVAIGDGFVLTSARGQVRPCALTVVPTDHTCYQFDAPEGEGDGLLYPEYQPLGFRIRLYAGVDATAQESAVTVGFKYATPTVASVISAAGPGVFPTAGGVTIMVMGDNFGATRQGRTPDLSVQFSRDDAGRALVCTDLLRVSHTVINCTLPEGSGASMAAQVRVAGLLGTTPNRFDYSPPVIVSANVFNRTGGGFGQGPPVTQLQMTVPPLPGFSKPMPSPYTWGGDILELVGENFGVYAPNLHCVFLTWSHRRSNPVPARVHTCNGLEDWWGEGELGSRNTGQNPTVLDWNHTYIRIVVPPGLGYKDIELSIRGRTLGLPQYHPDLWRIAYRTPSITSLRVGDPQGGGFNPTGEIVREVGTAGGELVTLWGLNLGTGGNTSLALDGQEVFVPPLPLSVAQGVPTAWIVLSFHRTCITNARALGIRPEGSLRLPGATRDISFQDCDYSVQRHDNNRIAFRTGAGIGANRTITVMVIDSSPRNDPRNVVHTMVSPPLPFSFRAPSITTFDPNRVLFAGEPLAVDISGTDFGTAEPAEMVRQGWTDEEQRVKVVVGGLERACKTPEGVDPERRGQGGRTIIQCNTDPVIMKAGFRNVSLTIAGQSGFVEAGESGRSLLFACAPGFYGRLDETCLPCPAQSDDPVRRGADCPGYLANLPRPRNVSGVISGFADDAPERFSYPIPRRGWYNLNSSDAYTRRVDGNPSMLDACPSASYRDAGRDVCIVPCDPPESCLVDNWCSEGYTSKPPMWRCASCDRGYYKRAGECIKCPDSPAALFVGFALLVVVVATVGFMLNKKQINIAVISIGVDFFQVLAIFAQARVKWPPVVKELLHILSAFNLNIEIVAPECLVPDISYRQKFWFIMILPLVIAGLFAVSFVAMVVNKALIKGRPKNKWFTHRPAMVSSCLVLLYLLYLYLTRTIMDVFNCAPTIPPTFDNKGKMLTYLQVVFEECGVPGGTQLTLIPFAVAGVIVYVVGYPSFVAFTLFKNRELVMEDQLLRAKGTGQDRLSNPHAYEFRRMFGRSYFQFKPDWCMWILAIIFRKFLIAITAVVFGKNSSFQMAACLLIMFLAYAAQVQIRPYMSPGDWDEVLRAHQESSYSSSIHARLRAVLQGVETRGKKRVRKNLVNFEGKVDKTAVFGVLTGFFFNYNTVEAIMQFCAVIVCLMAIMYQANELTSVYPESRDSVTTVLMIIIIWAIVYFFTVFITEIVVLYNEDTRTKQLAKAARAGRKGEKSGSDKDSAGSKSSRQNDGRLVDGEGALNLGKVETATNPMFLKQDGNASGGPEGSADATVDALMRLNDAPPVELWRVFQSAFAEMQEANKALKEQVNAYKKSSERAEMLAGEEGEGEGGRARSRTTSGGGPGAKKALFAPKAISDLGSSEGGSPTTAATFKGSVGKSGPSLASLKKLKA